MRISGNTMDDKGCICKGNWRAIVKDNEHLIGKKFVFEGTGEYWTLFGLVHGDDDYYYGMFSICGRQTMLLSCVGSIEGHGFTLVDV
jgi:hypothetical protein